MVSEANVKSEKTLKPKKSTSKPKESATLESSDASVPVKKARPSRKKKSETVVESVTQEKPQHLLYTLKFNSPILPFAKFPLTQNKYISDFLKKYEEEKDNIKRVIGVHFMGNNNSNAQDVVGIDIDIIKKNNITIVESNNNRRFKVKSYDELTNYCLAEDYVDEFTTFTKKEEDSKEQDSRYQDLLMSELFELKN